MVVDLAFRVTLEWSTFYQVVLQQSEVNIFFVFLCAEEILDIPSEIGEYDPKEDEESPCKYVRLEVLESW